MVEPANVHPSGSPERPTHLDGPVLRVVRLPGRQGLRVVGEVDLTTHRDWVSALESLLVDGTPARLDLSGLSFVDARGTVALVAVARRLAPGRTLTLYRPPVCLRRILDLFWSGELIEITSENEEQG